jgi:hypothetical protein
MDMFALTPDGATPKPTAAVRVKVIDVKEKRRVFPPDGGDPLGFPVSVDMNALGNDAYRTSANRRRLEDMLEKRLADQVTKLFYKHERLNFGQGVTQMEG